MNLRTWSCGVMANRAGSISRPARSRYARRKARGDGFRGGEQDFRLPFRRPAGRFGATASRIDPIHARPAYARTRLTVKCTCRIWWERRRLQAPGSCRSSKRISSRFHARPVADDTGAARALDHSLYLIPTAEVPVTQPGARFDSRAGAVAVEVCRAHAVFPRPKRAPPARIRGA